MLKIRLRWLLSLFCVVSSCVLTFLYLYLSNDKVSSEVTATSLLKGTEVKEVIQLKQIDTTNSKNLDEAIKKAEDSEKTLIRCFDINGKEISANIKLFGKDISITVPHNAIKTITEDGEEIDLTETPIKH